MQLDRRSFLGATALGGGRILGANDRINCATIGMGGRGTYLTGQFRAQGVDIMAVCDVYEARLEAGLKVASPGARPFVDYRRCSRRSRSTPLSLPRRTTSMLKC